jgi:hypothetical protein
MISVWTAGISAEIQTEQFPNTNVGRCSQTICLVTDFCVIFNNAIEYDVKIGILAYVCFATVCCKRLFLSILKYGHV